MSSQPQHPRLRWRPRPYLWQPDFRPTSVSLHPDLVSLRKAVAKHSRNEVYLITRMRLAPSLSSTALSPSPSSTAEQPPAPVPTWVIFKYQSKIRRVAFQKVRLNKLPLGGNPITPWTYILGNDGHLGEIAWVEDGYFARDAALPTREPAEPWIEGVVPHELANDGRLLVWTPAMMLCPSIDELPGVMMWLHKGLLGGKKIKACGSFHAWSNIAVTDGIQIAPDNLKLITPVADEVPALYKTDAKFDHHLLLRCGSGNRLCEVNQYAWERGLAFAALGGFDGQTMGGVFNTGTHGSVFTSSHLAEDIISLDLVLATGELLRIEPAGGITEPTAFAAAHDPKDARLLQDDDYFNAVLINMGTMGVVASYVLRLTPRYHLKEVRTQTSISEVKQTLSGGAIYSLSSVEGSGPPHQIAQAEPRISDGTDGGFRGHPLPAYHLEILINSHGSKAVVTTRHPLPVEDAQDAKMEFQPPRRDLIRTLQRGARFRRTSFATWFQERFGHLLIRVVDMLISLFPWIIPHFNNIVLASLMRESYIDRSFNVFNIGAGTNNLPALACTIFVPVADDAFVVALETVLKRAREFAARGMHNTAPTSVRFIKASRAMLGIGEDCCSLEFIFTARTRHAQEVIDGYDAALRDAMGAFFKDKEGEKIREYDEKGAGGRSESNGRHRVRVHWGQMLREPDAETLVGMYPSYPRWREIRDELDPGEVFLNEWQTRVFPKVG
ncbi:FAD-binding protein [Candidatus Bathyarchaeota archaeon]|nr:FAD-binding protein [Candidatus Bathyarchaeota archaeon]